MFNCYLDDSDNDVGPNMGIAGYVAPVLKWRSFEAEARTFLARNFVSRLHAKDFHRGHHDFKGWSGARKAAFVHELYEVASRHVTSGVSCIVNKSDYAKIRDKDPGLENLSPLGVAFASCVMNLCYKDHLASMQPSEIPLSFIVELGNKNNGNLIKYFKWLKDNWSKNAPPLGTISFVAKEDSVAIQLADFLSFHVRRESDRWAKTGYKDFASRGHTMQIIEASPLLHRHNRIYDNGKPFEILTEFQLFDNLNAFFVPDRGFN